MEVQELIAKKKALESEIYDLISKYIKETDGFLTTIDVDIVSAEYQSGKKEIVRIDVNVNTVI